ncbi:MAG: DUF92 domain-containing protein [bacterium]|nr:DUF92 domain-containing protein [bacterium]
MVCDLSCFLWAVSIVILLVAYSRKQLDSLGFLSGIVMGFALFFAGGFNWLIPMIIFFVLGSLFTSFKKDLKKELGVNGKARTWKNVWANGGAAFIFAVLAILFPSHSNTLYLALIACLSVALADTSATELGQIFGKKPVSPITLQPAKIGEPGAVSKEGLLASFVGSTIIGLWGYITGVTLEIVAIIVVIGFLGAFLDSILGATFEKRGIFNTHLINFLTTFLGGVIALVIFI